MNFEAMIGTTGIASDGETLYIANNTMITIIDRNDKKTDIKHGYDIIEDIAVSEGFLAGICVKNEIYGIFLLNLDSSNFTTIQSLSYEPYRIKIVTNVSENIPTITAMDNKFKRYIYDEFLIEKSTIPGISMSYNDVDIEIGPNQEYLMSTTEIKQGLTEDKLPINLEGELLTIQLYLNHLFIVYMSHYNMYSVVQYNLNEKTKLKEIEGGYFSRRIYTCIHRQCLYISSTLNKIIQLNLFSFNPQELADTSSRFSLYEMNSIIPDLIEDTLDVDLAKMKQRKQSFAVDTGTAENSHLKYFLWAIIAVVFIILIYISFMVPATGTINIILLIILLVVALFILRSYI
jgi:hypothetical protein